MDLSHLLRALLANFFFLEIAHIQDEYNTSSKRSLIGSSTLLDTLTNSSAFTLHSTRYAFVHFALQKMGLRNIYLDFPTACLGYVGVDLDSASSSKLEKNSRKAEPSFQTNHSLMSSSGNSGDSINPLDFV